MTKEHIAKMQGARAERSANKTHIEIGDIEIFSYDHGWILNIGKESNRYYSDLSQLFKKLFSIKLSRVQIESVTAMDRCVKQALNEILTVTKRLEKEILDKNE